jgi:hypothetical protein
MNEKAIAIIGGITAVIGLITVIITLFINILNKNRKGKKNEIEPIASESGQGKVEIGNVVNIQTNQNREEKKTKEPIKIKLIITIIGIGLIAVNIPFFINILNKNREEKPNQIVQNVSDGVGVVLSGTGNEVSIHNSKTETINNYYPQSQKPQPKPLEEKILKIDLSTERKWGEVFDGDVYIQVENIFPGFTDYYTVKGSITVKTTGEKEPLEYFKASDKPLEMGKYKIDAKEVGEEYVIFRIIKETL